jgi:hypothetical protein
MIKKYHQLLMENCSEDAKSQAISPLVNNSQFEDDDFDRQSEKTVKSR